MNKKFIISGIILILISTTGCILQSPDENPPYSVLPALLLDYDFNEDVIKIWVQSALSDFKYDSITIKISGNDETHTFEDNNTYCLFAVTELNSFDVHIVAISDDKTFEEEIKVDVNEAREDLIIITTYDENTDKEKENTIKEDDLPYKKILNEVKEEV